jgi:hypothetical protein
MIPKKEKGEFSDVTLSVLNKLKEHIK